MNSTVTMRLDMATNTWSTGPVFTPQRADFALAASGTKLFAIGGDLNGGSLSDASTQVNELETATWPSGSWISSPDNLPTARQGNQAGFFTGRSGGEIWSTGGLAGGVYSNEHLFRSAPRPLTCQDYEVTSASGTMVPGVTDVGNHCDECVTAIALPFPFTFYDQTFTSANVSSNGNLQFSTSNIRSTNTALSTARFAAAIFPFWDDLRTNQAGQGIFTSVQGSAPNRAFTIEWRAANYASTGTTNFELRLFEGSSRFETIYGATSGTFDGTIGAQRDSSESFRHFLGQCSC